MSTGVSAIFVIVGLVNLFPVVGVVSAQRIERLYGVSTSNPDTVVLLRHRAVLFGILGVLLLTAAFDPDLQLLIGTAGCIAKFTQRAIGPPGHASCLSASWRTSGPPGGALVFAPSSRSSTPGGAPIARPCSTRSKIQV